MQRSVWIGYDDREQEAFAVAVASLRRRMSRPVPVFCLRLGEAVRRGLYTRATTRRGAQLWDDISHAPMSTEFAISRFLVPHLARQVGGEWALFMDCDMLVRADINGLFDACDPAMAVMVVKHEHAPPEGIKMDGVMQTVYARKNWSSVCAFNVAHPANRKLTPELVNALPGRDLHAFSWLADDEIGELDPRWNYLVGHTKGVSDPAIVHLTDGIPTMPGYEDCEYAEEWRAERDLGGWAA